MRRWTIGIVGGGPGGLLTAYRLEQLAAIPPEITIFEATDRLGGKVRTESFRCQPVRYEAGAAELYDYSAIDDDPLKDLVAELGLATVPMGGATAISDGCLIETVDELAEQLGPAVHDAYLAFDRQAKAAVSPREFYEATQAEAAAQAAGQARFSQSLDSLPSAARRYLEQLMHSDLATEPAATSQRYGLDNYVMNDPAYMRLYCIAGGNDQLIARLASRLTATVRLQHRVTAVGSNPAGHLQLAWQTPTASGEQQFDALVLALPVEPLSRLSFRETGLAASMNRHLTHHDHPGHYLRVSMLFDQPFWRTWLRDSYCMLDAFGGCCLYDETAREPEATHGVLGWLLGGGAAQQLAELPDDQLVALALESLPATWRPADLQVREARVHRWVGAVSGQPGGFATLGLDHRHQPDPAGHPRLLLVGDYLFDSTLNGVLDSADYAAGWLATMMGDEEQPA